jgi:hypothetical protein
MLKPDELTGALTDALRAVQPPCTTFCVSGAQIDEQRYMIYHNGTGSRDSDCQVVHAPAVLGLSREHLATRLAAWIGALHRRRRFDLNEDKVG